MQSHDKSQEQLIKEITELRYENIRIKAQFEQYVNERNKAEKALSEQEELFSLFMKNSPVYVFLKDINPTESRVIQTSDNYQEMIGISGSEMIGKTMYELFPADFAEKMTQDDWEVVSNGVVLKLEEDFNDRNYTTIKFPIVKNGKTLLAGYTIDITEHKKAEQALRGSEEKFRKLIETTDTGYVIINEFGFVLDANQNYINMSGHNSLNEILNHNVLEWTLETDKDNNSKAIKQCANEGFIRDFKINYIHSDGRVIPIELNATAVKQESGIKILTLCRDISERKRAEEALKESEEKFRRLHEDGPLGIALTNINYNFILANNTFCNILGYSEKELSELTFKDITHPDYLSVDAENVNRLLNGEIRIYKTEKRYVRKDKNIIWGSLTLSSIFSNDGQFLYFVVMLEDITERKIAEKALYESEKKYRLIIENIRDVFYHVDRNGILSEISPSINNYGNYKREELIGQPVINVYRNPGDRIKFLRALQEKGELSDYAATFTTNDDNIIYASNSAHVIYDSEGNFNGIVGSLRDITERKEAEKRQYLFAKILEILNRPNDWQFIIKDILHEIKSLTGFNAVGIRLHEGNDYPYFIQEGFADDFVEKENYLCAIKENASLQKYQDELPILECTCGVVISGNTDPSKPYFTEGGSFWTNQSTNLLELTPEKDPRINPRNRCIHSGYLSFALIPVKSGKEIIGLLQLNDTLPNRFTLNIIKFFEDIAGAIGVAFSRMKNEEMIKEAEKKYRNIFENALEGIFQTTPEGKFVNVNPAFSNILGYSSPEELISSIYSITEQIYANPDERENLLLMLNDRGWINDYQLEVFRKDGERIWLSETINTVFDNSGKIKYYEGIANDITQRKNYEDALKIAAKKAEEMSQLKSNFLANMSHELRTPMVGIMGFSQILMTEEDIGDLKEIGTLIFQSSKRLMETLNLILDLSLIESGQLQLVYSEVNIVEEINNAIKLFNAVAKNKELNLEFNTNFQILTFQTDKRAFISIINNLINNALKYTDKGEVIVNLNIDKSNNQIIINVSDTGIGISEEDIDKIFQEFRQASEGQSRSFEGTGLGLTITQKFVVLLGGTLKVVSKMGKGSTFTVQLPIKDCESAYITKKLTESSEIGTEEHTIVPERKKPLILYVEDDETSVLYVEKLLKNLFNIDIATSGKEALEKVVQRQYSLILMDINLGSAMNGLEATREIQRIPGYETTPIIAVTAYAMVGDRERFLESGCTGYVSKPFDRGEFLSLLNEELT
jgi:PAS domain S-box-containing protein